MAAIKIHKEFLTQAEEVLENLGDTAADTVVDRARTRAPVDTGALRDSIHKIGGTGGSVFIGSNLPYAGRIEYGTSKTPPQSFLRSALDSLRNDPPPVREK